VVERHAHEDPHFVLVLEGLYISSAAGAPAVSAAPLLVYNPAGTVHRDRFESRSAGRGRRVEGRFLTLSIDAALADAAAADGRVPEVATVLADPDAFAIARRLARAVSSAEPDESTLRAESLALTLLASAATGHRPGGASPPSWLAVARELLDDPCGDDVRIAELAQAAGVHPVHLARVFRQHLGCTPGDYLRRRRLERAAALLRQTARPLSDVALHCGFGDQSHFTNAFRRYSGVTPGAYRRGG
jgi:AraC family transcriptional regulator